MGAEVSEGVTRGDAPSAEGSQLKAYVLFCGSGPILVLTTFSSITHEQLVEKLLHKGIRKFIAYQVPISRVREQYGVPFEVISNELASTGDLRVLDFNGHQVFSKFSVKEFGDPVTHGE
jgi:hypothetical protein